MDERGFVWLTPTPLPRWKRLIPRWIWVLYGRWAMRNWTPLGYVDEGEKHDHNGL
jgi:hypothetical protein